MTESDNNKIKKTKVKTENNNKKKFKQSKNSVIKTKITDRKNPPMLRKNRPLNSK